MAITEEQNERLTEILQALEPEIKKKSLAKQTGLVELLGDELRG